MLRNGFKATANAIARRERELLHLPAHSPIDPRMIAQRLGIKVLPLSAFASTHAKSVRQLSRVDSGAFSACTVHCGEKALIVLNDAHQLPRQVADTAHELAHKILQHPVRPAFDKRGCRYVDVDSEEEANWLGPAILVSDEAALHIARCGIPLNEAASKYGVSEQLMRFRLNVTGAFKRVA